MFTKGGALKNAFEGVGETIGQVGKTVKQTPQDMANAAAQQVAIQQQSAALQQEHGATNRDIISSMYGIELNQHVPQTNQQQHAQQNGQPQQAADGSSKILTSEEQQTLAKIRARLFNEYKARVFPEGNYYAQLTKYENKKPEPRPQEEEEKEKEKKKQQMELQKEEQKKKEIPINMRPKGAGEVKHGVGG